MADFVSHDFFGSDAIRDFNSWAKKICGYYDKAFRWGLQGPDFLMCHHFLSGGSEVSTLGLTLHMAYLDDLFFTMARTINETQYSALSRSMNAYFFGFLCHYALDSEIHPYVFAMMEKMINDSQSDDDKMLHLQVETDIDIELYRQRTGKSIRMYQVSDHYHTPSLGNEHNLLYGTIERLYLPVLQKVYAYPAVKKEIDESLDTAYTLRTMQYKNTGLSLFLINSFSRDEMEKRRNAATIKYQEPKWDVLNLGHNPWLDLNGKERTDDVGRIFLIAEEKACALVDRYTKMFADRSIERIHFPIDFEGEPNKNTSII